VTALLAGVITFALTTFLTIAGLGAAFVLIPVFLALGVEVHTAMATALLLNALSMSVASVRFVRQRLVDFGLAVPMVIVAVVLSPVGVWVSRGLPRSQLLWGFVVFLLFAAAMMFFYQPRRRLVVVAAGPRVVLGLGVGGLAGFVGGLLGVGGGNLILPALVGAGLDPKRASATSAFVVVFASFAGFAGHLGTGGISYPLLGWTAAGAAAGALLGSWLMTDKLNSRQVKLLIGAVLVVVAVKMIWGLAA
jgi:uncharacterized membrane protein YfcA